MSPQFDNHPAREGRSKKTSNFNPRVSMPSNVVVKAKLEMTEPGDADEREADEMADSIIYEGKIARSVSTGHSGSGIALPSHFGDQLASLQGNGSRLYGDLKTRMESGFGRVFSDVRLHTDGAAAEMSDRISAKAFTYGNDIYFNRGQFNPGTIAGQHLIAHELTHVAQGIGRIAREQEKHLDVDVAFKNTGHAQMIRDDYKLAFLVINEAIDHLQSIQSENDPLIKIIKRWFDIDIGFIFRNSLSNNGRKAMEDNLKSIIGIYQTMSNAMASQKFCFSNDEGAFPNAWAYTLSFLSLDDFSNASKPEDALEKERHTVHIPYRTGRQPLNQKLFYFNEDEDKDIQNYFDLSDANRLQTIIHELAHRIIGANFTNHPKPQDKYVFEKENEAFLKELYGTFARTDVDEGVSVTYRNMVQKWKALYPNESYFKYALQNADTIALFALNIHFPNMDEFS